MPGIVQIVFLCQETLSIRQVAGALMLNAVHIAAWIFCNHQNRPTCVKSFFTL